MTYRLLLLTAVVAFALGGCSKGEQQTNAPQPGATATLGNTTGLPLPDNATIVDARDIHQTINPSQEGGTAVTSLAKGSYVGHEVVASTPATVDDLDKWLATVAAPQGYNKANTPANVAATAHKYGISYVAFVSGNSKGATIVIMDPHTVAMKLGPVLSVIEKYNAMPEPLRQSMDAQVKARTGQSISEMLDKSAPLGAAVAAMSDFRTSNNRAIILVTAEKQ
ncbi:MAG: hypothetical protein JO219_12155 [Candidatus Eremiobacteraeota bacterium]|nr:hypothetical protein [Candidatus Eremiobacteraeota bacterium]MBV8366267.1 hypothetical protein [Candidatus Eremiobacteraeota bacterium]